jgi:hypothetical protein
VELTIITEACHQDEGLEVKELLSAGDYHVALSCQAWQDVPRYYTITQSHTAILWVIPGHSFSNISANSSHTLFASPTPSSLQTSVEG